MAAVHFVQHSQLSSATTERSCLRLGAEKLLLAVRGRRLSFDKHACVNAVLCASKHRSVLVARLKGNVNLRTMWFLAQAVLVRPFLCMSRVYVSTGNNAGLLF